jgi:hypothetical protein
MGAPGGPQPSWLGGIDERPGTPSGVCRSLVGADPGSAAELRGSVMHTEPAHEVRHHKPRHIAEKVEGLLGMAMVVIVAILAVGLVWGLMQSGNATPTWMR